MRDERRVRIVRRVAAATLGVAFVVAAIVPGDAWSPGSPELADASLIDGGRVVEPGTGLTITPAPGGAMVSTGDGGGAGLVTGVGAPLRVRRATFRGAPCWEIGSHPGDPAAYVNANGVRLDDGMLDRLRARAWMLALAVLALGVLLWRVR